MQDKNICIGRGRSVSARVRRDRLAGHQMDRQYRRDIRALHQSTRRDVSLAARSICHGERRIGVQISF